MKASDRTLERRNSVRLFGEKSVSVLLTGKKLVHFNSSQTIEMALRTLAEHHIQAAPVQLSPSDAKKIASKRKKSKWLGMIGIMDLVRVVLKEFDANMLDKENQQTQLLHKTLANLWEEKRMEKSVFFTVHKTETIEELLMIFGRGIHRVAVIDEGDNILHIATQSTVVEYIAEHTNYLGRLTDLTAQELGFLKKVLTINENEATLVAFRTMIQNTVTAVAVVDQEGKLVGNLSATDLKGLIDFSEGKFSGKFFDPLRLPVKDFLQRVRELSGKPNNFVLTCLSSSKLLEIVQLLAKNHVHRIFIVDSNNKPCGVASLTDICAELFLESEENLLTKRLEDAGSPKDD